MRDAPTGWLTIDRALGDLEGQLHRAVRERILSGQLGAGQPLPSTRALAAMLGLARSTVVQAYARLQAEGFLEAVTGSATRVAALPSLPARALAADAVAVAREPDGAGLFQPGVPDLAAFPHHVWARCLAARARALRVHDLGYDAAGGIPALRHAILAHAAASRGVAATPDQVLIVPSTRAAIDLLASQLLRPGANRVWIEEPGYPAAQEILRACGARLVPVPCDPSGLDPAAAPAGSPRLIYVTPSHQYPTGATMSLPRRLATLRAAQAGDAIILEDDYDSEFQYGSRPIAALQGIDRGGSVAYLGTFSKVLAPGLRVAYAILPTALLPQAASAQRRRGAFVPIHVQAALADFMRDGHLRAHIRRMRPVYAARMAATAAALRRHCADWLTIAPSDGGLQLLAWFRDPAVDDRAAERALRAGGFAMRALSALHLGTPRPGLLFGIAQLPAEQTDPAVRRIADILHRSVIAGRARAM